MGTIDNLATVMLWSDYIIPFAIFAVIMILFAYAYFFFKLQEKKVLRNQRKKEKLEERNKKEELKNE